MPRGGVAERTHRTHRLHRPSPRPAVAPRVTKEASGHLVGGFLGAGPLGYSYPGNAGTYLRRYTSASAAAAWWNNLTALSFLLFSVHSLFRMKNRFSAFRRGLVLAALLAGGRLTAQAQSVGIGTTTPNASAALEVKSTSQGLLLPRLTAAQRAAIASPAAGLQVFQSDGTVGMYYYNGNAWINLTNGRVPDANGSTNTSVVSTLAGTVGVQGSANGSPGTFRSPCGIAVDGSGNLYVADRNNNAVRKVTAGGVVSTLAGTPGVYGSADGTGGTASFNSPYGVAVDATGTVFLADINDFTIRKITAAGVVTTLAGVHGQQGGTDGPAASARFSYPTGVAVDAAGNVFVVDNGDHTVRKITPGGTVSTFAGQAGSQGSADGPGAGARFYFPEGLAIDGAGNLYVTDGSNRTIRKITPAGVVSTLAGTAGVAGNADGFGAAASFSNPRGIASDAGGTLYVADNQTIRRIAPNGLVTTMAGTYNSAGSTDGPALSARFNGPIGVAVDAAGAVYVTDNGNQTIRVIR